jgi:hypothetical protein
VSVSPELYLVSRPQGAIPGGNLDLGGASPSQPCPSHRNYIQFKTPGCTPRGQPGTWGRIPKSTVPRGISSGLYTVTNPRGHSLGAGWNLGEYPRANRVRGNLPGITYCINPPEGVSLGVIRVRIPGTIYGFKTPRGNPRGQPGSWGSLPNSTVSDSPELYTV